MKCFKCSNGEKKEGANSKKSTSSQSNSTTSTDRDTRRSGSDPFNSKKSTSSQSNSTMSTDRDPGRLVSEYNSRNVSDTSNESVGRPPSLSFFQRSNNLRVFTFSELKNATRNFSRALMLGEGGFGCVYRGMIRSSEDPNTKLEIAVKQLNHKGLQGHKEWLAEVNVLGVVEHPNLVKLVGYCADDDERGLQRLLVYEYMPNRSVEDHLLNRTNAPLSWDMRLRIALDAARGLTYLHEGMDFQIIFRDLKTSNILLDEHWNAKLSDFGLAREGPVEGLTHVSTSVVGTAGYAAPEYILTGRLTAKCDTWSYGVVLYELITGRRPLDINRPKSEQKLVEWVKPYATDPKKIQMIIDPRLAGHCSEMSALKLAAVANRCLIRQRKSRPKMSEVLEMIQGVVENAETGSPQNPLRSNTSEEVTSEETKKEERNSKGRTGDLKTGDRRQSAWLGWARNL